MWGIRVCSRITAQTVQTVCVCLCMYMCPLILCQLIWLEPSQPAVARCKLARFQTTSRHFGRVHFVYATMYILKIVTEGFPLDTAQLLKPHR